MSLHAIALVLLLAACGSEEDAPSACEDAACRQAAVLATFAEDPQAGAAAVAALPDDVERAAVVARLMEAHPSQISGLCGALPQGKLRVRCQRTSDRPHLWHERTKPVKTGLRAAGGPKSHRLAPEGTRVSRMADVPGDLGICRNAPDPHSCAWARAVELGRQGKAMPAAAKCAAIEVSQGSVELWQAECRFSVAEALVQSQEAAGYADAAELCLTAGRFQERCLIHLARDLAARTPAADRKPGPALASVVQSAQAIGTFWADDAAAEKFVDHFWSVAMGYAFLRAESVTGDIIDGTPAEVLPHIHAAAAWRLMQLHGDARSLQAWSAALKQALNRRAARPAGEASAVHMPGLGNLWHAEVNEEAQFRAVIYMGMGRRAMSENPDADRLISLLEGAARQTPPLQSVLAQGAQHQTPAVRWTSERLIRVGGLPVGVKAGPAK